MSSASSGALRLQRRLLLGVERRHALESRLVHGAQRPPEPLAQLDLSFLAALRHVEASVAVGTTHVQDARAPVDVGPSEPERLAEADPGVCEAEEERGERPERMHRLPVALDRVRVGRGQDWSGSPPTTATVARRFIHPCLARASPSGLSATENARTPCRAGDIACGKCRCAGITRPRAGQTPASDPLPPPSAPHARRRVTAIRSWSDRACFRGTA